MFWTEKVLFIHPPRVGGDWLTRWALRHLKASEIYKLKHATKDEILVKLPDLASHVSFTIARDEDDRKRSWKRLTGLDGPLTVKEFGEVDLTFPYERDLVTCVRWLTEIHQCQQQ